MDPRHPDLKRCPHKTSSCREAEKMVSIVSPSEPETQDHFAVLGILTVTLTSFMTW